MRDVAAGRWRASSLISAPHRLCFFWAGGNWALAALWWAAHLCAVTWGAPWAWQLPPASAHALWFALGAMPLFIAGFMFTAGPKWLRRPAVDARRLRTAVGLFIAGWVLAVVGFQGSLVLASAGLALVSLGWCLLSGRIVFMVAASRQADRLHAMVVAAAAVCIAASLIASAVALALEQMQWVAPLANFGLWCGVALVFLVVSHRMLPFLGDGIWPWLDARWPNWPLWALGSALVVQGLLSAAGPAFGAAFMPASGWHWLVSAHLALVALISLWLSLRWVGKRALRQPMVAMLYGALWWWNLALVLGALAWLPAWNGATAVALGRAALHAATLGWMGSTLLVMVTRISSTHSGRPQAIDRAARVLYALVQVAAVARLVAALWPLAAAMLLPLAALAWAMVATAWAVRHGRWLGMPRVDGRGG